MFNLPTRSSRPETRSNRRAELAILGMVLALMVPLGAQADPLHLSDPVTGVTGQEFATALAGLDDISGDGLSELLVGAPGDDTAGSDAGAAFLWLGGTDVTHEPVEIWYGQANERFGFSVADIGDVNGDGDPDFAVGAPLSDAGGSEKGRICIYFGGGSLPSSPDVVIGGEVAGDQFGYSLEAAGDFNGDGKDDLIVGAPYHDSTGLDAGAAYVILGATGGPSTDLDDAVKLTGEIAGDHFGWSVCGIGNFFGGNEESVAVGAPGNDSHWGQDAGAVYLYEGSLHPASPDANHDLLCGVGGTAKPNSSFGWVVRSAGNWDSDGYTDLAVGAPGNNQTGTDAGRVEIFFGDPSPSSDADRYVTGQDGGDQLGYSLVNLEDFSGSSNHDLLIGAPYHAADGTDAGRAYIYEGGSSSGSYTRLDALAIDPMVGGNEAGDLYGFSVAACENFDGDGLPDFGIGAPGGNIATTAPAGYCHFMASDPQTVGVFDYRVSCAWDGDGMAQLRLDLPGRLADIVDLKMWRVALRHGEASDARVLLRSGRVQEDTDHVFRMTDVGPFPDGAEAITYLGELTLADGTITQLEGWGLLALADRPSLTALATRPAFPNPANPRASVELLVAPGEAFAVDVLDIRGRLVRRVLSGEGDGTWQVADWDGRDQGGRTVPSGTYFFRMTSGDNQDTRKVVLAR